MQNAKCEMQNEGIRTVKYNEIKNPIFCRTLLFALLIINPAEFMKLNSKIILHFAL